MNFLAVNAQGRKDSVILVDKYIGTTYRAVGSNFEVVRPWLIAWSYCHLYYCFKQLAIQT